MGLVDPQIERAPVLHSTLRDAPLTSVLHFFYALFTVRTITARVLLVTLPCWFST
jgi:hypothetical protein